MSLAPLIATATLCRVCGGDALRAFTARERMLGLGESFLYHECGSCGCLQIAEVPDDLGRFYPERYYSFAAAGDDGARDGGFPSWSLTMGNVLAAAIQARAHGGELPAGELARRAADEYLKPLGAGPDSRILDVGCGGGGFLRALHELGFRRLAGVDPYLAADRELAPGLWVRRGDLGDIGDLGGGWDLVMLHHSFEHLSEPGGTLRRIAAVLAPGGACLIRTPIVPCEAWERYGGDWMQLDAPRHLIVHSLASLERLAAEADLEVTAVTYDSGFLQFAISEQYRRGIPLTDERSFVTNPAASGLSPRDIGVFVARAHWLNAQRRGDQVAVHLRRRGAATIEEEASR